jgi:hypothetical protein
MSQILVGCGTTTSYDGQRPRPNSAATSKPTLLGMMHAVERRVKLKKTGPNSQEYQGASRGCRGEGGSWLARKRQSATPVAGYGPVAKE